jgi:hypothetical protein
VTKASDDDMQAPFQADLEKAKSAAENARGTMTAAATKMFAIYADLLSVKVKYAWNKIIQEQTEGNPHVDLQGVSQKGPRGMSHQLFDGYVLFHLLNVFSINMAEQEKYYITNVLKKPQRVNVCQFVRCVEHSMPTLLRCHACTTAPASMPTPNPKMFLSQRFS